MKRIPSALFVMICLILSSCNLGSPAPQDTAALATSAALTVEAALASPAASPTAGAQAAQTASPIPGVAIDGTTAEPAPCEDKSQILEWERDFVPFDKTETEKPLAPGKSFWIALLIQNAGSCVWTHDYKVQYRAGDRLHTGPDTFPFMQTGFTVNPGETFKLQLQFTAPAAPGVYESTYSLINPEGYPFLNFGIPTRVGVQSTGSLTAPGDLRYQYNCAPGIVNMTLTWKDRSNNEEGFRIYRDGAKLTDLPPGSTIYEDTLPAPGTYVYTVSAFNSSGEAPANVAAETTNCQ